ncbi:MAG: hypothetical protein ACI8UZ_000415 [Akkermansiaceae bacterium]
MSNPANSFYHLEQIALTSLRVFQDTQVSHHDLLSNSKTFYSNRPKSDKHPREDGTRLGASIASVLDLFKGFKNLGETLAAVDLMDFRVSKGVKKLRKINSLC